LCWTKKALRLANAHIFMAKLTKFTMKNNVIKKTVFTRKQSFFV